MKCVIVLALLAAVLAVPPTCSEYCTAFFGACPTYATTFFTDNEANCALFCDLFPLGDYTNATTPDGATIACRLREVEQARVTDQEDLYCPNAGLTGGSVCGSLCDNYCAVQENGPCASTFNDPNGNFSPGTCQAVCATYAVADTSANPAADGSNSVECRIYHGGLPAISSADTHCPHASPSGGGVCGGSAGPCESYCNMLDATCGSLLDGPLYFGAIGNCTSQCMSNIDLSDAGTAFGPSVTAGDSFGCRVYHGAVPAFLDAEFHCPHSGLMGGNACGAWCDVYCDMFQTNCGSSGFQYANNGACQTACANFPTNGTYTSTVGDSVQCRIYHAAVSADLPNPHCSHASQNGGGVCGGTIPITCGQFCQNYFASTVCTATNHWPDVNACADWCQALPPGQLFGVAAATEFSLQCHVYHLEVAEGVGATDGVHCGHAGLTGGDQCGTYCQNYCAQEARNCPATFGGAAPAFDMQACLDLCGNFPVSAASNDLAPSADVSNSVQCRIYHASWPSVASAATHCPHASPLGGGVCGSPCDGYCQQVADTCGANLAAGPIYFAGSVFADCNAACDLIPATDVATAFGAVTGNTIGCRSYHGSFPALADDELHCPHASFNGGNVCGSYCEVYCDLFQSVCGTTASAYSSSTDCMNACANFPTDGSYTSVGGDNVQCRIYHAAAADLTSDLIHCVHASQGGDGVCGGQATTTIAATTAAGTTAAGTTAGTTAAGTTAASTTTSGSVALSFSAVILAIAIVLALLQ